MNSKRIVIAGGSGFIGRALAQEFSAQNFEVVILTRTPRARTDNIREVEWDGKHIGDSKSRRRGSGYQSHWQKHQLLAHAGKSERDNCVARGFGRRHRSSFGTR